MNKKSKQGTVKMDKKPATQKSKSSRGMVVLYFIFLVLFWSGAVVLFVQTDIKRIETQVTDNAINHTRSLLEKDISYYRWVGEQNDIFFVKTQQSEVDLKDKKVDGSDAHRIELMPFTADALLGLSQSLWAKKTGSAIAIYTAPNQADEPIQSSLESLFASEIRVKSNQISRENKEYMSVMLPLEFNGNPEQGAKVTKVIALQYPMVELFKKAADEKTALVSKYAIVWVLGVLVLIVVLILLLSTIKSLEKRLLAAGGVPLTNNQQKSTNSFMSQSLDIAQLKSSLQNFVEYIPYPAYIKDDNGKFVVVNQHLVDYLGCTKETLVGTSGSSYLPPELTSYYYQFERVLAGINEPTLAETFNAASQSLHLGILYPVKDSFGDTEGLAASFSPLASQNGDAIQLASHSMLIDNMMPLSIASTKYSSGPVAIDRTPVSATSSTSNSSIDALSSLNAGWGEPQEPVESQNLFDIPPTESVNTNKVHEIKEPKGPEDFLWTQHDDAKVTDETERKLFEEPSQQRMKSSTSSYAFDSKAFSDKVANPMTIGETHSASEEPDPLLNKTEKDYFGRAESDSVFSAALHNEQPIASETNNLYAFEPSKAQEQAGAQKTVDYFAASSIDRNKSASEVNNLFAATAHQSVSGSVSDELAAFVDTEAAEVLRTTTAPHAEVFAKPIGVEKVIPEPVAKPVIEEKPVKPSSRALNVLVVDDDETETRAICDGLKKLGHNVIFANSATTGIEMLDRHRIDVIFMDIQMPVMNGIQATMSIRKLERQKGTSRKPIIAIASNATASSKEQYKACGMDDYVVYSVPVNELADLVEDIISSFHL